MKKTTLLLLVALCILFVCSCDIVKSPDYYKLNDDDTVASFTKAVGERKVSGQNISMSNAIQVITYSYKNVKDPYGDAEKYIDYLSGEEDFSYSGMLDMDEKADTITLTKKSPNNKDYVIRVTIKYDVGPETVKITVERERAY